MRRAQIVAGRPLLSGVGVPMESRDIWVTDVDLERLRKLELGKISVLAPLGTAVLGFRRGDAFEWRMPGRDRRLQVEEVLYQPEAAGDYHR